MRHGKKFNHLKRKSGHRKALLKNMSIALIEHKRIKTTLAKAKALRVYVEPLITKARKGTVHDRRVVFSYLQNKEATKELFDTIAEQIGDRPGGYVRVIKLGFRKSDGAEMALVELVDFNEDYAVQSEVETGDTGKRRRRRRGGNTNVATAVEEVANGFEEIEEEVEETLDEVADELEETAEELNESEEEETSEEDKTEK